MAANGRPGPTSETRGVPLNRTAVLAGIGSFLPERVVPNSELAQTLETSDEWIRSRTGIRQRRFAGPGSATSDLAVQAGRRALRSSGLDSVDAVLLATATPDHPCPATAPVIATRLGLDGVGAYDISAVCSGFIYGLATASGLICAGLAASVLVIGADTYSTILDPADRTTSVLFGDGAGAAVLRVGAPDELGALGPFDLGSDGAGSELITVRGPGSRQRLSGAPVPVGSEFFSMAGQQVFWLAVQRMSGSATKVLAEAGWDRAELDWLFCHQANIRIQNSLADAVQLPRSRCYSNIDLVGNTAAASIPLALDHAHAAGLLRPGQRLLLTAFGGGLTWGSTVLRWPELPAPVTPAVRTRDLTADPEISPPT